MDPKDMDTSECILISGRRERFNTDKKKGDWRWRPRLEWCGHKLRKIEEARNNLLIPRMQPRDTNFRLLVSRTIIRYFSFVLSHQICGNLLQEPRKINILSQYNPARRNWSPYFLVLLPGTMGLPSIRQESEPQWNCGLQSHNAEPMLLPILTELCPEFILQKCIWLVTPKFLL